MRCLRLDRDGTVIALDGANTAAGAVDYSAASGSWCLMLTGYRQSAGAWCFTVAGATACADVSAPLGYTRIAGVHDPAADEIRVHVDGVLSGSADLVGPPWKDGDGFVLDVSAYFGVLTDAEIAALGL